MLSLNKEILKKTIESKGYKWFENGVNIIGVRTNDATPNKFNDFICICYKDVFYGFEATTDPGMYWLKKPMNVKGTAILVPGQYIDSWTIGLHSKYEALRQVKPVAIYRDNNRNEVLDMNPNTIQKGVFGINIHRAHLTVLQWVVEKYSAGCQVIRSAKAFSKFMEICKSSKQTYFSYTLLEEKDLAK